MEINEISPDEFGKKAKEMKRKKAEYERKFKYLAEQLAALHNDYIHEFRISGKYSGHFYIDNGNWECSIKENTLWRRFTIWLVGVIHE